MKYLKYRDLFLERKFEEVKPSIIEPIFEINSGGLENDITWGGSLLGRLINSAIRKGKIEYQAKKIESVIEDVKKELDRLYQDLLDDNDKREISSIMARLILDKIYNEVKSDHDVPKKLDELLGNNAVDGMIDAAIKYVKGVEIENKDALIDKLEKFKADLLKSRKESQDDKEDDAQGEQGEQGAQGAQGESSEDSAKIFYTNAQKFLQSIVNLHLDIKNNTVKFVKDGEDFKSGNKCIYTNKKGEKQSVVVLSIANFIKKGDDKVFLTKDDYPDKDKSPLQANQIHIAVIGPDGKTEGEGFVVNRDQLSKEGSNSENIKTGFDEVTYKKIPENDYDSLAKKISLAAGAIKTYSQSKVKDKQGNVKLKEKDKVNLYKNEFSKLYKKIVSLTTPAIVNKFNEYEKFKDNTDKSSLQKRKNICIEQKAKLEELMKLQNKKQELFPVTEGLIVEVKEADGDNWKIIQGGKIVGVKYQRLFAFYNDELKRVEKDLSIVGKVQTTTPSNTTKPVVDEDAHKRAVEERKKLGISESLFTWDDYDFLLEEVDANVTEVETDAKTSWNKVIRAYNTSGIVKYIPYIESLLNTMGKDKDARISARKKIKEICSQVIINYDNVGKPISYNQLISEAETVSTNDVAKSISLLGRVVLAYNTIELEDGEWKDKGDLGLLGSFGKSSSAEGKEGGAGNHIKSFINSFNEMRKIYPKIKSKQVEVKKESFSFLKDYSTFRLLCEADDDELDISNVDDENGDDNKEGTEKDVAQGDSETDSNQDDVQKSYFKFFKEGEEKEWSVDENKVKEINEKDHKIKPIDIGKPDDYDHIIKIVNSFGRAYNIYATDYIPSGRPAGRISLKTMREYEKIGKGDGRWEESTGPGFGPWGVKKILNKWNDGITKILENPKYRKVLATGFVSKAESDTNTEMSNKTTQSGRTLMTFINEMLDNEEGTFKKHRKTLFNKYFNLDPKDDGKNKGSGTGNKDLSVSIDDIEGYNIPFWSDSGAPNSIANLAVESGSFIKFLASDGQYYIMYTLPKSPDYPNERLFKMQRSSKDSPKESIIKEYTKNLKDKDNKPYDYKNYELTNKPDLTVYIGYFDKTATAFKSGSNFVFKIIKMEDVKSNRYNKEDVSITVKTEPKIFKIVKDDRGGVPRNVNVSGTQIDNRYDKKITKPEDIKKIISEFKK